MGTDLLKNDRVGSAGNVLCFERAADAHEHAARVPADHQPGAGRPAVLLLPPLVRRHLLVERTVVDSHPLFGTQASADAGQQVQRVLTERANCQCTAHRPSALIRKKTSAYIYIYMYKAIRTRLLFSEWSNSWCGSWDFFCSLLLGSDGVLFSYLSRLLCLAIWPNPTSHPIQISFRNKKKSNGTGSDLQMPIDNGSAIQLRCGSRDFWFHFWSGGVLLSCSLRLLLCLHRGECEQECDGPGSRLGTGFDLRCLFFYCLRHDGIRSAERNGPTENVILEDWSSQRLI